MKFLVIGDLHLGKTYFPFLKFTKNPYFDSPTSKSFANIWTDNLIQYIRSTVYNILSGFKKESVTVVFLGDVLDNVRIPEKIVKELLKIKLLDFILDTHSNCTISIVIGNHDKNIKRQKKQSSILHKFQNYRNRVVVYEETTLISSKIVGDILYFPYILKKEFIHNLSKFKNMIYGEPIIFSHNNMYVNDCFGSAYTFQKKDVNTILNISNCVLFNGHFHRHFYEDGFFLTGSVAPTSMKDDFQSRGICFYDSVSKKIEIFKNNSMVFMSIANENHLEKLFEMLQYAKEANCKVALQITQDVRKYVKNICKIFPETVVATSFHGE